MRNGKRCKQRYVVCKIEYIYICQASQLKNILFPLAKRVQPEVGDNAKRAEMRRDHGELWVGICNQETLYYSLVGR